MGATEHVCPFCDRSARVYQPNEDISDYEFALHGDCGHFWATGETVALLRSRADAYRERKREWVLARNAKGDVPRLQP